MNKFTKHQRVRVNATVMEDEECDLEVRQRLNSAEGEVVGQSYMNEECVDVRIDGSSNVAINVFRESELDLIPTSNDPLPSLRKLRAHLETFMDETIEMKDYTGTIRSLSKMLSRKVTGQIEFLKTT